MRENDTQERSDAQPSRTFAIDYDGTWSADPTAFAAFAALLRRRGHRVIIVTARVGGRGEVERECRPHVDAIVFSGANYKREAAAASGETVHVWIDDRPEMIGCSIAWPDAQEHARVRRQMEQFGAVQCDACGWWNLPIHVCHECGFDPSMEGK
jgi:hypothetical protein